MNRQFRVWVAVAFLLPCNARFARPEAAAAPSYPVTPIRFIVACPTGRTDIALGV